MMPTWKAATHRPEAPSGSCGEVRMAADCSMGDIAVAVAPHAPMATIPSSIVTPVWRPPKANPASTAKTSVKPPRPLMIAALGRRSPERASSPMAVRPAIP